MSLSEQWAGVWDRLKGSPTEVIRGRAIPAERVFGGGTRPPRIVPNEHYFSVSINEMFLAESRQWFNVYDPMALVVSEFTYNGKPTVVPFVAGPSLLKGNVEKIKGAGVSITDTMVAGMHPYVGGKFALTVVLAQVKRESYAARLLKVVEGVAGAFAMGVALVPQLKVAGAVMEGVESLFGMSETRALAGQRWEFNDGASPWLVPGFFALVGEDERKTAGETLSVVGGRLRDGIGEMAPGFRKADFLLYSLAVAERRADITELAFYHTFNTAKRDAASIDRGGWNRAKAALVTLYQDMLTSPDLILGQVEELADDFTKVLVDVHKRALAFSTLGDEERASARNRGETSGVNGDLDKRARLDRLGEIDKLLDLA